MNKKILALVLSVVLTSFAVAGVAMAQDGLADGCRITNTTRLPTSLNCTTTLQNGSYYCLYNSGDCGMCCLLNGVYNVTDWIFVALMAIASLMIVWGAIKFTTSQGKPEETTQARNLILYAAVGIAVALFARAIPAAVKMIIGA